MKKYLVFVLILLAPLFASAQTFERDLRFGLQGNADVTKLQGFLADRGLYSGPITGNFFSLTLKAVKKFQTQENIKPASGYVGAKTRKKLNQLFALELEDSDKQAKIETTVPPISVSTAPTKTESTKPNVMGSIMEQFQQTNVAPPNTILCNGVYWTPCQTGQNFYCPATGEAQCLVESNLNQNSLTQGQIDKISRINKTLEQFTNQQRQQQELARQQELKQLECITVSIPEEERIFDPATQDYLRKLRCGVATDSDKTNYELSKLRYSVNELKYRLDSKMSFPQSLANQIKPIPVGNVFWELRWEGSGGTVTNSNGGFYQFHCEYNSCRSY